MRLPVIQPLNKSIIIFRLYCSISLFLLCAVNGLSQQDEYFQLAKSYSSIQYFYPNPGLAELDWDNFLVQEVDQILKRNFDLEQTMRELAPEITFHKSYNTKERLLSPQSLSENLYYQHFGGIETEDGNSKDILMKSLIVGNDLKSFSMLLKLIPMTKSINHNIKIRFHAKWKSEKKGRALIMLHSGYKEKGEMKKKYHKVYIDPSDEWKYYELDTVFCQDCPARIFNALKIIRPDNDTLLIDELMIIDEDTNDTLFYHGFENYDYTYTQFTEYEAYISSESIRPSPSKDYVKGDYSLKLIGNNHLSLYPQTTLDSFIQVSLGRNYSMEFPRFLNKSNSYDFEETITKYNSKDFENYNKKTIYIADIIKLWTIAEQSYPYTKIKKEIDARALLEKCIRRVKKTTYDATAHFHNIVYLHAAYRDPHLNTYWKGKSAVKPPVIPQWIDGAYRVGLIYDEKYRSYFGKEITHINGCKTDQWFSEKMYDAKSINSKHLLNNSLKYFCYSYDSRIKYTFRLKDGTKLIFNPSDLTDQMRRVLSPFSYLKDTIQSIANDEAMYIRISRFGKLNKRKDKKRFSFVKDSLSKYKWLILDFRNNHINYTSELILEYKKRANKLNAKPDFNSIIDEPFKDNFEGEALNVLNIARNEIEYFDFPPKIIALINENTRSAPERHLLPLYDEGLVTLVGQATAGTASFTNKLLLPSGIKLSITTGRTLYKGGDPYQDNGLQPDYRVDDSLSEQDMYLQKALEIIANEKN